MQQLKTQLARPFIIAAMVAALLITGAIGYYAGGQATPSDPGISQGDTIQLERHKGPGRHRRCKPKGKYAKPPPPRKCRRNPPGRG